MNELNATQNPIIVGIAIIAADLHQIMHIAWTVSLAAKNARIISSQAGEMGRGFQPITSYIDDITKSTLNITNKVENESVQLTHDAAQHLKALDRKARYHRIFRDAAGSAHIDSLQRAGDANRNQLEKGRQKLGRHLKMLEAYLEELSENMRAALAVAAICRIEAAQAGKYRDNLTVVADDLQQAAHTIQGMLQSGLKRIGDMQAAIFKTAGNAQ